jgi:hypothetical protein
MHPVGVVVRDGRDEQLVGAELATPGAKWCWASQYRW